ncbi:MAG: hypothetical protein K2N51_18925 [Lachnospiraceae bacterium]|nr:hypothetical protein [Lachnospiraceae bacterium]
MTLEERNILYEKIDEASIEVNTPMNIQQIKAFVKGCEYAFETFLDAVDETYRETKND